MPQFLIFFLLCLTNVAWCQEEPPPDLERDLCLVQYWNHRINDKLPVYYNTSGYVGYFNMPSARMNNEGSFAFGFAYVPPYLNWTVDFQFLDRLEISGAYRIFRGVQDANLSPLGFGDYADKGINAKICLLKPEDTDYTLPGISVGLDDFLGSRMFAAQWVVATKVCPDWDLEWSVGWGWGRLSGPFSAVAWTPWRQWDNPWINGLTLEAEYDCTAYTDPQLEPHPQGRIVKSRINAGIKYHFLSYLDLSVSSLRGVDVASSIALVYPIGSAKGPLPKTDNPKFYRRPLDREPIGPNRPEITLCNELAFAMQKQGLILMSAYLEYGCESQRVLRLIVVNRQWRTEAQMHERLAHVLATLIPMNVDEIVVVLEDTGLHCQEYRFRLPDLLLFADNRMGPLELDVLSPTREVTHNPCSQELFKRRPKLFVPQITPRVRTFFGSAKGKFKFSVGLSANVHGYLFDDIFYKFQVGYTLYSGMSDVQDMDYLNPSQLLNVHSDWINYHQTNHITFEHAYLQKSWNLTHGFFARLATGYFEASYAGTAIEALYYPAQSPWAIGLEYALLKKRDYVGFGFQREIRKFVGFTPTYVPYTFLSEVFFDAYYNFESINTEMKLMVGRFVAKDFGFRTELMRFFKNGVRLGFWYTITNGHDVVNGSIYYDKGFMFSIPTDFFKKHTSRDRLGYSMAAWLRDVGYRAGTGHRLYNTISEERRWR